MGKLFCIILAFLVVLSFTPVLYAMEHGGKEHGGAAHAETTMEHGGKEHGGVKAETPSAETIRETMKAYVADKSKAAGTFEVTDAVEGKTRRLTLEKVHERVGKTGDYYYSCADFKDADTGELLDLDLDVEDKDGVLSVRDVRIHKVNGKERYTYDENDNRIPILAE